MLWPYKAHECMLISLQRLGKGLKELPRNEVVLATKFGRYGPNLFDFSAERVRGTGSTDVQSAQQ